MDDPSEPGLLLHATTVAIGGTGVAIEGASGAGKSDLALRLIDGGALLVADDQTRLVREGDVLVASAPPSIAGLLEARGLGIVRLAHARRAALRLVVAAAPAAAIERLPEPESRELLGLRVPMIRLDLLSVSAAAKVRLAVSNLA